MNQRIQNMFRIGMVGAGFLSVPLISFAQAFQDTKSIFTGFQGLMNTAIVIATLLAFLFFVWGIAKFIRGADDPTARDAGRQQMIWGVVALTVLVSIWGIVTFLQGEFLIGNDSGGIGKIMEMFGFGGGASSSSGGSGLNSGGSGLGGESYDNCIVNPSAPGC